MTAQEVLDFYNQLQWPIVHQRADESFFWLMDDAEMLKCTIYGMDRFVSVQYGDETLRMKVLEIREDGTLYVDSGNVVKVMSVSEAEKIVEEKEAAEAEEEGEESSLAPTKDGSNSDKD